MKRLNALISLAMIVLLAFHGLGNALQIFAVGSVVPAILGWALLLLACLHIAIGTVTTLAAVHEQKRAHVAYWGLNKRFWIVRISGAAIALFVICHVLIFAQFGAEGPVRLAYFGTPQLVVSLALVVSLMVHIFANVQGLLISFGIANLRGRTVDLVIVVCLLLVICAFAFIFYFLRWSVM